MEAKSDNGKQKRFNQQISNQWEPNKITKGTSRHMKHRPLCKTSRMPLLNTNRIKSIKFKAQLI